MNNVNGIPVHSSVMEDILIKCRLCLKISENHTVNLFKDDKGDSLSRKILEMLSLEVISLSKCMSGRVTNSHLITA